MIKISYGSENKGKIVFATDHTFGRGIHKEDQATMLVRAVIRKHEDASKFGFYEKETQLCGGWFYPQPDKS